MLIEPSYRLPSDNKVCSCAQAMFGSLPLSQRPLFQMSTPDLLGFLRLCLVSCPRLANSTVLVQETLPSQLQQAVLSEVPTRPVAIWRAVSLRQRHAAAELAVTGLDASLSAPRAWSAFHDVIVVGAGLAGLSVGSFFAAAHADVVILEQGTSAGGVWRTYGNPMSRVNSTEVRCSFASLLMLGCLQIHSHLKPMP